MDFTLLRDYFGQSCEGWLMSEKFDGWRVGVSGGRLVTRGGNFLDAPQWFMDGLPDGIDAELFAGRSAFYSIQGRMRDGWCGNGKMLNHIGTLREWLNTCIMICRFPPTSTKPHTLPQYTRSRKNAGRNALSMW
jgi:hypothetical protein